ncbi:hypothetical protein SOASR029_21090 [Budvicia aquatica]|nr:hypothetical protein SOASR029_21090 [Budvicia aquatica]
MEKTSTKKRPYKEKESYKWQKASEQMASRLGDTQSRVISVCDREADIWQYLDYKVRQGERFVIRAAHDRCFEESRIGYIMGTDSNFRLQKQVLLWSVLKLNLYLL